MKKVLYFLSAVLIASLVFFVLNTLSNRSKNKDIDIDLLRADSLMFIKPDSSLLILNRMSNPTNFDNDHRALYSLLLVQAQSRNYIRAENDSLIKIALDYYANSNDSIKKAWTYFYATDVYMDLEDKIQALPYIQKAATTATNCGDDRLLCYIYYKWARLLQDEKPYDESINKMHESEMYARNMNDTTLIVNRLLELGWSNMSKKDYDRTIILIDDAIYLTEKAKLSEYYPVSFDRKSIALYFKKHYNESLLYSTKAINNIRFANDSLSIYAFRGRLLIKMNQLDSAHYYIQRGKSDKTFYNRANYRDLMSLLEEAKGDYKSALAHRVEYAKLLDSIYIEEDNNKVMAFQKKYDFSKMKTENDELKIENQLKDIYLLIFIIVLLCVAFAVYFYISYLRKKVSDIVVAKDQLLSRAITQAQKKNNELMVEQQQFQEKEFELLNSLTNKENELNELYQEQRNLKESIFKMNDVVKKIEKIKEMPVKQRVTAPSSMMLTDKELESLIDSVNLCYDGFVDRLMDKYPDLSKEDLYLCCLLRMGVTNQNIITLLNTTDSTLKKRKYRLKKEKLSLAQELETLEIYLESV